MRAMFSNTELLQLIEVVRKLTIHTRPTPKELALFGRVARTLETAYGKAPDDAEEGVVDGDAAVAPARFPSATPDAPSR